MDHANRLQKLFPQQTLEQIGSSARFECAQHLYVSRVSRQNNDSSRREFSANREHAVDTSQFGDLQMHQSHIRTMFSELFDRLAAIRSLSNKCHVRLAGQKRSDTLAEKGMVVHGENANRGPISAHRPPSFLCGITENRRGRGMLHMLPNPECATPLPSPLRLRSKYRDALRPARRARACPANPNAHRVPRPVTSGQCPFHHPGYAAEEDVRHK